MICARSLAIRLAKVIIAKYIDPIKLLPYWVHGRTNVASWTKPKIFRSEDVDRAIMVATSKTEHFVRHSEIYRFSWQLTPLFQGQRPLFAMINV